jgi:hypothetical protein
MYKILDERVSNPRKVRPHLFRLRLMLRAHMFGQRRSGHIRLLTFCTLVPLLGLVLGHVNLQSCTHFSTFGTLFAIVPIVDPFVRQHRVDVFELFATIGKRALKVLLVRMNEEMLLQAIALSEGFLAVRALEFLIGPMGLAQVAFQVGRLVETLAAGFALKFLVNDSFNSSMSV